MSQQQQINGKSQCGSYDQSNKLQEKEILWLPLSTKKRYE